MNCGALELPASAAVIDPGPIASWLDPKSRRDVFVYRTVYSAAPGLQHACIGVGKEYTCSSFCLSIFWKRSRLPGELIGATVLTAVLTAVWT